MRNRPLWIFWTLLVVLVLARCFTISFSPVHWGDEVTITEICRGGIVIKNTDWSILLFLSGVNAVPYWFGSWWSEAGYQLFGCLGPRIMVLIWFLLSVVTVGSYVLRKVNNRWFALFLMIAYAAHPAITFSVCSARVDIIVFTFLFAILDLLDLKVSVTKEPYLLMGVGLLVSALIFSWATALVLLPIVFVAFVQHCKERDGRCCLKKMVLSAFLVAIPMLIGVALFLMPFFLAPDFDVRSTLSAIRQNFVHGEIPPFSQTLVAFLREFTTPPFFYCVGCGLLCLRKRTWGYAFFAFIVCLLFAKSFSYVSRVIYLLPYALLGFVFIGRDLRNRKILIVMNLIMGGMAAFSYVRSVVVRNVTEFVCKDYRNYSAVRAAMEKEIGRDVKIYVDTYSLYYIGRELGWKQYMAVRLVQLPADEQAAFEKYVGKADYYICEGWMPDAGKLNCLRENGFAFVKTVYENKPREGGRLLEFLKKKGRLSPYGPYYLFAKR